MSNNLQNDRKTKDPNAIKPYHFIWCDASNRNDGTKQDRGYLKGATISTVTWPDFPAGITNDSDDTAVVNIDGISYLINTVVTIWLSGGTPGTTYPITCRIETSDNRTDDKTMFIYVKEN